ncbi:hypothetical protein Tco_0778845, partial [Tanacetum coccineum]
MDSEVVKGDKEKDEGSVTRAEESSSKRAGTKLEQERIKKQKIDDDQEKAEMKKHMEIIVDEEEIAVDAIPLATKPPVIVDRKIVKEGNMGYFQLIRVDGSLRRDALVTRMASAAAKPCQEDSYEFYLITGTVMSSASSAVTYTSVYTDSEPGRAFWGAKDEEPVALPSPDYIPGPEDPQTPPIPQDEDEREPMFVQAHDPDYVLEPIYLEYIPLEDEHELPTEEQPLRPVDSPTAESPGYVAESDPEEDLEEYEDDETKDGSVDYPMDGGDDGDDDDSDSSRDDVDDEDEDEDEEEEEHLAP